MAQTATPALGWQNKFSTTLTSGITSTDTTIPLNALPTPSEGFLVIEPDSATNWEVIYYTSKMGSGVVCTSAANGRGVDDSTAVSHAQGATVRMDTTAGMFEVLQNMSAVTPGAVGASPFADGWALIANKTPDTVTYNGQRSYDLVFNGYDMTGYISNGMKLKTVRTVAAPTQCTSLNGTTQYFNKTSPAGMTFTNQFVGDAWVKLTSYAAANVISRYNGTSGWRLDITAAGQPEIWGYNGGAGNYSGATAYQSLPLNKWVHIAAYLDMAAFAYTSDSGATNSFIMIDGVVVPGSVSRAGTNPTSLAQAGNLEVGSYNGGTSPWPGKLAQVAVFNARVAPATLLGYMSQGLAGTETSLISAYSFNNSINDLNTTNANNLTAQGSAVPTNADSPFTQNASGTPTGTTDYAIVMNTAFSTNTTLTVQVPEGCTIPTSGGVTSVSYSTQASPYGYRGASSVVGYAEIRANFTTTSGTAVQVPGLSVTLPAMPSGRNIRITAFTYALGISSGTQSPELSIYDGTVASGTRLQDSAIVAIGASITYSPATPQIVVASSSSAKTYNVGLLASGGATATCNSSVSSPSFLMIELLPNL